METFARLEAKTDVSSQKRNPFESCNPSNFDVQHECILVPQRLMIRNKFFDAKNLVG